MKSYLLTIFIFLAPLISISQEYDDYIGAGHAIGVSATSSDIQSNPINSVNGEGYELDIQGSSKFLAHATLGYTIDDIENITENGIESWIDEQLNIEGEDLTLPTIEKIYTAYFACMNEFGIGCPLVFNLDARYFRYSWSHNMRYGQDLLRQRVAMALSEIVVISDKSMLNQSPHALANFYDLLTRNAFGNYKDILTETTLHPAMGFYLSHINNPKSFPEFNIRPDENYAREIMQLFSIGLYELNQDGSRKTDPDTGLWIPTYDNEDIQGLAKVFTGLSGSKWADDNNTSPVEFGRPYNSYSLIDPMAMYPFWHEPGEKTILGNYTIPAGQTGMEDINDAIDHLFNHDNVGPFLAIRLIQRLVKSNPSPQYISRVAGVFADNGNGIRGDLAAMTKAILLDDEALDCYWTTDIKNGMLRTPILRLTQMLKGLKAEAPNGIFWNSATYFENQAGQHPMGSPTVFNFYQPDYVPDSEFAYENIVGPEFQILNSSTSSNYVNYMMLALLADYFNVRFQDIPGYNPIINILNEPSFIQWVPDNEEYAAVLSDPYLLELASNPEEWIDYLDITIANGLLSDQTKERIIDSMKKSDILDPMSGALYGLFLVMINPEYVIMK
jgi:uncharacterized protein (DUF1800 family)